MTGYHSTLLSSQVPLSWVVTFQSLYLGTPRGFSPPPPLSSVQQGERDL